MRLLTFRRAADPTESESIEETSDEAVDTAAMEDETHATEAPGEVDEKDHHDEPTRKRRRVPWSRVIAYGILPALAFLLASAAGYLKWQDGSAREAQAARRIGAGRHR